MSAPYGEPEFILRTDDTTLGDNAEPSITSGDPNGDGLEDVVITGLEFQTYNTWESVILLNDGHGGLADE